MFEIINWPEEMMPSRSPIHLTNEIEVAASPETIWSLLTDTGSWPDFYPSVKEVGLLDGHEAMRLGSRFETNLAGQDMLGVVNEFEPISRLAWYAYPKASEASRCYHAWILTPSAKGTHVWTEETMQGPLFLEGAKQAPEIYWRTHEKLLAALDLASIERSGAMF